MCDVAIFFLVWLGRFRLHSGVSGLDEVGLGWQTMAATIKCLLIDVHGSLPESRQRFDEFNDIVQKHMARLTSGHCIWTVPSVFNLYVAVRRQNNIATFLRRMLSVYYARCACV